MTGEPANVLEVTLKQARDGTVPIDTFLKLFMRSDIAVPSGGQISADGSGFRPLLFNKEGVQMVACFTSVERVKRFSDLTPYSLSMKGADFVRRLPSGYGLVINPGETVGMDVTPDGLRRIVADFLPHQP